MPPELQATCREETPSIAREVTYPITDASSAIAVRQPTDRSSTSKTSVEFGGITSPKPRSP